MKRPNRRRSWWIAIPLVAVGLAVATVVGADRQPDLAVAEPSLRARFDTSDVSAVTAGTPATIGIVGEDPAASGVAQALIISAVAAEPVQVRIERGVGTLAIDARHTRRSGIVTVSLVAPGDPDPMDTLQLSVRPADGRHSLDLNVGPAHLALGDVTMAVGLLTDPFGNPVADGTPVDLLVTTPDGAQRVIELRSRLGLTVAEVSSVDLGRFFRLAMQGAETHSLIETVTVQADPPAPFELLAEDSQRRADGRSRLTITSTALTDETGSAPADGTNVDIIVASTAGTSMVGGEVIDGRVRATLVAPAAPSTLVVTARVDGVLSAPLEVEFEPAVLRFPVRFETQSGVRRLVIGPVLDPDGGVAPDGTIVEAGRVQLELVRGRAVLELDPGVAPPTVRVLGVEGQIE